jgi:hypothetical protein
MRKGYPSLMTGSQGERTLESLLWGGVAVVGQYTMLFLSVIGRIHVRFEHDAPVFYMEPKGLIPLTKDAALSSVWIMTGLYGLLVTLVAYRRPSPSKRAWAIVGVLVAVLAVIAALAVPLWGLVIIADLVALLPWLTTAAPTKSHP